MPSGSSSPMESRIPESSMRKRVGKACDRCRLKKSKCDGMSVCGRCRADNAICVFGERKKTHDKVYPKGYVEMLEQQQSQLVAGLQELYRRASAGQGWKGAPLSGSNKGVPLTHDILERLGALKAASAHTTRESFEEDLNSLQRRLIADGAGYMPRPSSTDSDSECSHSQSPRPSKALKKTDQGDRTRKRLPPTPPSQSPGHFGPSDSFNSADFADRSPSWFPDVMDDLSLSSPHAQQQQQQQSQQSWASAGLAFDEPLNSPFLMDSPISLDGTSMNMFDSTTSSPMPAGTIAPFLSMRNFGQDADFQKFFNAGTF